MRRQRLDLELVRRGLAGTQTEAREAIMGGRVIVDGRPSLKPNGLVRRDEPVSIERRSREYVSRGGEKLAAALDRFGVDATGKRCLDAGASTGGFTDVLLARGAAHVLAVDVGYGQLAWRLRTDDRVTVWERTNVRRLRTESLPFAPDLLVADLAFISLGKVVPVLAPVAATPADLVLLVKPQFEVRREDVGPGGVVTDPAVWRRAIETVAACCRWSGIGPLDVMASPLSGPAGNVEFFLHARKGEAGNELDLGRAVQEARRP